MRYMNDYEDPSIKESGRKNEKGQKKKTENVPSPSSLVHIHTSYSKLSCFHTTNHQNPLLLSFC